MHKGFSLPKLYHKKKSNLVQGRNKKYNQTDAIHHAEEFSKYVSKMRRDSKDTGLRKSLDIENLKKRLKNSNIEGNEVVGRRSKSILNAPDSMRNLHAKLPEIGKNKRNSSNPNASNIIRFDSIGRLSLDMKSARWKVKEDYSK